jgi:orotidine 5'-phosphate decarboxylase subfamily 1
MSDDRLIVALDVPNALDGLALADRLGDNVGFYKIGLGMLTGGGLALANELKAERGKRIFLDMKLFDIGATVEAAVRGLAQFDLDFLTVHGDPHVVRAACEGASGSDLRILAVTILTSLDRGDLDENLIRSGSLKDLVIERASRALDAGAHGVIASPARGRRHPCASRRRRTPHRHARRAPPRGRPGRSEAHRDAGRGHLGRGGSHRCGPPDPSLDRSRGDGARHYRVTAAILTLLTPGWKISSPSSRNIQARAAFKVYPTRTRAARCKIPTETGQTAFRPPTGRP